MKRRSLIVAAIAVVVLFVGAGVAVRFVLFPDRLAFTVSNHSGAPLKDVAIMLGERMHALGDMDEEVNASVTVWALPECSPRLKYVRDGRPLSVDLDTYLCSGMWGSMTIDVLPKSLRVKGVTGIYSIRPSVRSSRAIPVKPPPQPDKR